MTKSEALIALIVISATSGLAQHEHDMHADHQMPAHDHSMMGTHEMGGNRATQFLMSESSGTAFQPSAWPMPMLMQNAGDWHLMWMAQAFIVDTQQSGPSGGDKLYSNNWGMLSAVHNLGSGGSVMLRSMVSLEPATITDRRYPLLFQTGESAFGKPLVDAQHPHDLFMELFAVQYAHSVGEKGVWNVYYAPIGEPALGPVAYPHRASAMELPQATLAHHWQDSTHIADNVLTAGLTYGKVRLEASGFYGREPNENRWNIDFGAMDSWSGRLSVQPSKNWIAQVSSGRLHDPEGSHTGDVTRTTASLEYVLPKPGGKFWATSLIWGQNYEHVSGHSINAITAETVVPLSRRNLITGRYEWSQRDELFPVDREGPHGAFDVHGFTAGYTRDFALFPNVQTGFGANVSTYVTDAALRQIYGDHPWGVNIFFRARLMKSER